MVIRRTQSVAIEIHWMVFKENGIFSLISESLSLKGNSKWVKLINNFLAYDDECFIVDKLSI